MTVPECDPIPQQYSDAGPPETPLPSERLSAWSQWEDRSLQVKAYLVCCFSIKVTKHRGKTTQGRKICVGSVSEISVCLSRSAWQSWAAPLNHRGYLGRLIFSSHLSYYTASLWVSLWFLVGLLLLGNFFVNFP